MALLALRCDDQAKDEINVPIALSAFRDNGEPGIDNWLLRLSQPRRSHQGVWKPTTLALNTRSLLFLKNNNSKNVVKICSHVFSVFSEKNNPVCLSICYFVKCVYACRKFAHCFVQHWHVTLWCVVTVWCYPLVWCYSVMLPSGVMLPSSVMLPSGVMLQCGVTL